MSRGAQENERVRKNITEALFTLLKRKEFSGITVTDLVTEAGVARASYYRNFETKEAIVEAYIDSIYQELAATGTAMSFTHAYTYEEIVQQFERSLACLLRQKAYILTLYHHGFGSLLLEIMNRYVEEVAGEMPNTSVERYKLYFMTGAAFNVLIKWLEGGAVESPHTLAKACASFVQGEALVKPKEQSHWERDGVPHPG